MSQLRTSVSSSPELRTGAEEYGAVGVFMVFDAFEVNSGQHSWFMMAAARRIAARRVDAQPAWLSLSSSTRVRSATSVRCSRIWAAGLAFVMAGAFIFVHWGEPLVLGPDGSGSGFAFNMGIASLALMLIGPGRFSVDASLTRDSALARTAAS